MTVDELQERVELLGNLERQTARLRIAVEALKFIAYASRFEAANEGWRTAAQSALNRLELP